MEREETHATAHSGKTRDGGSVRTLTQDFTGCLDGKSESPSDSTITRLIPPAKDIVKCHEP